MSARQSDTIRPPKKRSESALTLPALFGKNQPLPAVLDPQTVALAEMRHEVLIAIAADNGMVVDTNPTALKLLNLERESILGQPLANVLHLPEISQYLLNLPAGRPVRFTQRMTLDPKVRANIWEFRVVRLPPPSDSLALVTAHPVEERRSSASGSWTQHLQSLPVATAHAIEFAGPQPLIDWLHTLPGVTFAALYGIPEKGDTYRHLTPDNIPTTIPKTFSTDAITSGSPRMIQAGTTSFEWIDRSHAAAIILFPHGNPSRPDVLMLGLSDMESASAISGLLPAFGLAMLAYGQAQTAEQPHPENKPTSEAETAFQALMDELPQALVLLRSKDGRVEEASLSC
jgi:hypothetical protein